MEITDKSEQALTKRYELLRLLGAGAAGEVYHARDLEKSREVVIKLLKNESCNDTTTVERFKNEFSSLKVCYHSNIVKVYDFHEITDVNKWFSSEQIDISELNARYFFTMEYIPGSPLKNLIYTKSDETDFEASITLLYQIAKGLQYIHERKLIHRDLKPDNIFISQSGEAKLLDFGIAKFEDSDLNLTTQNDAVGTSYYMSPEQIQRKTVDHRTDIYAFGILTFEMLTGSRPFDSESRMDLYLKHLAADIPSACKINSQLPSWVDTLISTCTQKEAPDRYQSMADLVALLKARCPFLIDEEQPAPEAEENWKSVEKRVAKKAIKQRFAVSGKQTLIMLTLTFAFWLAWMTPPGHWSTAQVLRTLFALRGPIPPPEDVVIVAIDDLSYQRLGIFPNQPMPRMIAAKLLERIHATKPKIVIVDGYFNKLNNEFLPKDKFNEEADLALERALQLGPTTLAGADENDEASKLYKSAPRFSRHALMELSMLGNTMGGYVSYIGLKILSDDIPLDERFPIRKALEAVNIQNLSTPGRFDLINYYGPPHHIARVPIHEVIENKLDFSNKVVLVGFQSKKIKEAPGSADTHYASGYWKKYYGVEIHANIVGNLLDHSYIRRLPRGLENWLFWMVSGLTFAIILVLKPSKAAKIFMGILSLWITATVTSFFLWNIYIPGALMFTIFGFPALGISWYYYARAADADLQQAEKMTNIEFRKHSGWNK